MRKLIVCKKDVFDYSFQIGFAMHWKHVTLPSITFLIFRCLNNSIEDEIQKDFKRCNVF